MSVLGVISIGDCSLPLLHNDHSGLCVPQKSGPTNNENMNIWKENILNDYVVDLYNISVVNLCTVKPVYKDHLQKVALREN